MPNFDYEQCATLMALAAEVIMNWCKKLAQKLTQFTRVLWKSMWEPCASKYNQGLTIRWCRKVA